MHWLIALDKAWFNGYPLWVHKELGISFYCDADLEVADYSVAKLFYDTVGAAAFKYLTKIIPMQLRSNPSAILACIDERNKGKKTFHPAHPNPETPTT